MDSHSLHGMVLVLQTIGHMLSCIRKADVKQQEAASSDEAHEKHTQQTSRTEAQVIDLRHAFTAH
jgi:hypothetical protein